MASQGKSKRRTKGKTLALQSFLNEEQEAPDGFAVVTTRNWADYTVDDDEEKNVYDSRREAAISNKVVLPTVPKSARAPGFDIAKVPTRPPFKAYLGNLPYDVTEEEITKFFKKLKISRVHLIRDTERGRSRGMGFAEFEERESLIEALNQNGDSLKNRTIRVSLSEGNDDRSRRDGGEDRTASDWRSSARENLPARNGSDYPSYDNNSYGRNERNDDSFRGRSNYDKGDRRPERSTGGGFERSYQRDREFRDSRDFNRDRGFDDRRGMGSDRGDRMRENRTNDRDRQGRNFSSNHERRSSATSQRYSPSPPVSTDSRGDDDSREPAKERPKLVLKPRTKPLEEKSEPSSANSAIFGGARPVDTTAKEKKIEEKLAKERQSLQDDTRSRDEDRSGSERASLAGDGESGKDANSRDNSRGPSGRARINKVSDNQDDVDEERDDDAPEVAPQPQLE